MATRDCTTCIFLHHANGRCGAYDMPALIARARPNLCGDAGADHTPAPDRITGWIEDWRTLAAIALLIVFIAAAQYGAIPK